MENQEYKTNTETKKTEEGNNKTEEVYRVTVTKVADEALTKIVDRINNGFEGGKVNRAEAVAWIVINFLKNISEPVLQEIRLEHFDEMALLASMFKKAKKTGKVPAELKGLLLRQVGADAPVSKKQKEKLPERLTESFINDEISK